MTPSSELAALERRRDWLREQLIGVGDFRPGTLSSVMRRCGKPNCACAARDHPGHGPQHLLTKKVAGKTVTAHLRPGPELDKARGEVGNYQRFRQLVEELIEVSEAICAARPVMPVTQPGRRTADAGSDGEKRGSAMRSPRRSRPR